MGKSKASARLLYLAAFDEESKELRVIIETAKGNRNKFNYDEHLGLFKLGGVLPSGASFPFDFGFVPSTTGGDGDPLDVLVLMDEAAFPGCLVTTRLIGVIEAEQTERDGEQTRNDRLIAIASAARTHQEIQSLTELSSQLVEEIEHFFISYNEIKGKKFRPLGRFGPEQAMKIVEDGIKQFRRKHKPAAKAGTGARAKAKKAR